MELLHLQSEINRRKSLGHLDSLSFGTELEQTHVSDSGIKTPTPPAAPSQVLCESVLKWNLGAVSL